MVHRIQHYSFGINIFQQRLAERVKRRQRHRFPALASRFHHARFHFARGFPCKRQSQDVLAGKLRIRVQELPDALSDNARFACACARDDQQRPFAVHNRAPLRLVELHAALVERFHLEQGLHELKRVAEFQSNRKRDQ